MSVIFNNKDLFNIYERHNSPNFELCCPLATNSAINPFNTNLSQLLRQPPVLVLLPYTLTPLHPAHHTPSHQLHHALPNVLPPAPCLLSPQLNSQPSPLVTDTDIFDTVSETWLLLSLSQHSPSIYCLPQPQEEKDKLRGNHQQAILLLVLHSINRTPVNALAHHLPPQLAGPDLILSFSLCLPSIHLPNNCPITELQKVP